MTGTMIVTMCVLFALSIPVAVSIGLAGLVGIVSFTNLPLLVLPQQPVVSIDRFPLAAVPFFILAGNLMEAGGISERLVNFAKSLVGGVQGGLACSCVLTCMIFASVSGSSVAITFAIGAILIPAMIRHGYPTPFAAALQATSGELGVIIPPSIPMILFGVAAEVSVGELFVAGIFPGLLIGFSLMAFVWVYCRYRGYGKDDSRERLGVPEATRQAFWALLMPGIILGGIYGGVFTPTEASAVAVVYAFFVGTVIYRKIGWAELVVVFHRSVVAAATIMLLIAAAGMFTFLISRAGIPALVGAWLVANFDGPLIFLLAVNVFLFLVGMFIETSAAILVLAPIFVPVAIKLGIDPVHFGMVMIVNLALGMITPPFGVNLFAACTVAKIPVEHIIARLLPFVLVVLSCLMVIS